MDYFSGGAGTQREADHSLKRCMDLYLLSTYWLFNVAEQLQELLSVQHGHVIVWECVLSENMST
jgi:hypothetical protein